MISADEALFWVPTAAVAAIASLALIVALAQPPRMGRAIWIGVTLVLGGIAVAATVWQQDRNQTELRGQGERLRPLASHVDELGRDLPAAAAAPSGPEDFASLAAAIDTVNGKLDALGSRIQAFREKAKNREIDPDTAAKMADYLRQFGSARVVVSCLPNDVEAYAYANQIANVLRAAGWSAHGPEETTIFGNAQGMGITLYVHAGGQAPAAAKVLLDAFARFNIPFKSGISPSEAIPDPATVELFVGHKA
jgi:hypothetical protein